MLKNTMVKNGLLKSIESGINMNTTDIARMDKPTLQKTYAKLTVDRMHEDKWFSDFLNENELDHNNPEDPNWAIYKQRLSEYRVLNSMIKSIEFQMGKK